MHQIHLTNTQHVKGHQDSTTPFHKLSRPAQLDIPADALATQALHCNQLSRSPPTTTQNPHCMIYLKDHHQLITSKEKHTLQWKWSDLRLQLYYEKTLRITKGNLHELNWAGFSNARKTLTTNELNFSIKLTINWLPIGACAYRTGNLISYCHQCKELETLQHLFTCPQNTKAKENYIVAMSTSLTAAKTSPTIKDTILHGLKKYLHLPSKFTIPATLQYCFTTQNTFGWHLLTAGLLIQQWSQHQQIHNNNNSQLPQTHLAGDIWNKKISTTLIHQAHRLWSTRCSKIHQT